MKKALMGWMLLVGMACGVSAQENAAQGRTNVAADFSDSSASQVTLFTPKDTAAFSIATPAPDASATPLPAAPTPNPQPKYVFFGDRDDYRWQLGVGLEFMRDSTPTPSMRTCGGVNTTLTYYTNNIGLRWKEAW